jgi:hypothetical protein
MKWIRLFPFYILLFYPIFGYTTWTLWDRQPFYYLCPLIVVSLIFTIFEEEHFHLPLYLKFFGLFVVVELISKYFIHNTALTFDVNLKRSFFYVASFLLLLLVENTRFDDDFINRAQKVFAGLIAIAVIVSIVQYFLPNFLVNPARIKIIDEPIIGYKRRISSIFSWGDHGYGGGLGVPILYLLLGLNFHKNKVVLFVLSVVSGLIILLLQARFGIMNYLIVLVFLYRKYLSIKRIGIGIAMVGIFIVCVILINEFIHFDFNYFVKRRLQSQTYKTRIVAVYAFKNQFPKNPIWGTGGLVTKELKKFYQRDTRIHNGYLAILYYYGIAGGACYFIFLFLLVKRLYRHAVQSGYWGAVVGILCFLFTNFTLDINHFVEPALIFMFILSKHHYDKTVPSLSAPSGVPSR